MKIQWHLQRPDSEKVTAIQRHLKCSVITATLLCNRKIESARLAADFLSPTLYHLTPPYAIKDMDHAVDRIENALLRRQRILIFGDYDVDGVTATAALYNFLQHAGAQVSYYIPHRVEEGYGLAAVHIHQIAIPKKIQLIITVDNGSSSHEAVLAAKSAGIDVIISDHHTVSKNLPSATAVINPKQNDCFSNLGHLSGVGVVFYLLICLRKRLRETGFWPGKKEPNLKNWCDLVALGTIADMVPLISDNRILAHTGITMMNTTPRPGIRAMIESLNLSKTSIDAEDIAFRLAPRLNAAGRMAHADAALSLLLCRNLPKARSLCTKLNQLNDRRKEVENEIFNLITTAPEQVFYAQQKSIVAIGKNWHVGVLGIVASRVAHRYVKPTIVLSEIDGIAKGSARSIPGLDIHAAISACKEDLIQYGGHAAAAGLALEIEHLPRFKERFEETVCNMTKAVDFTAKIHIDCELFFENIHPTLLDEIERLQPFGQANPAPIFMAKNIEILSVSPVGQSHRRMRLRQQGNARKHFGAIQFNIDPNETLPTFLNQIAFRLQWNHWNNARKIQLIVEAI